MSKFNYTIQSSPYTIRIYIAGNYDRIEQACSDFVTEVGLCVNVKKTNYIYTYGEQSGAEIGLISYPKFKEEYSEIWNKAQKLCEMIMDEYNQQSATIIDNNNQSIYIERN